MKKILTLLASPHKKGNTATVLSWVEDELKSLGETVERIDLTRKNIRPCLACNHCRRSDKPLDCAQKDDDAIALYQEILAAKAVLFASPLYFWSFSAQMKTFIDRGYMLVKNYGQPNHTSLVEGLAQAFLMTAADEEEDTGEDAVKCFRRIVEDFGKGRLAGHLVVKGCTTPGSLSPEVRERARDLARRLTSLA